MQDARCKIYNAFVLLFGIGVWVNLRDLRNLYFLFFETVSAGSTIERQPIAFQFWDWPAGFASHIVRCGERHRGEASAWIVEILVNSRDSHLRFSALLG